MSVFTNNSTGRGVVSCDWFCMSCKLGYPLDCELLPVPGGWSCLRMSPTAVWANRWYILDEFGNKVATFLATPRTPKISAVACNIQIANRFLYYSDFRDVCDKVCSIAPMAITGLNRVDLCCDFEMTPELYSTYIALARRDATLKGMQEGVSWWKRINVGDSPEDKRRDEVPNQLNWGGKDSTFKWKVYYKWLELATAAPEEQKPWILDTWKANGLSEKHVWRVEVSINGTNSLRALDGRKLAPFEWFDDRVRIFSDIYADKFVVRRREGHVDKRHDTILPFLEIDGSKAFKHALPVGSRDDSDPEKRLVCKLWQELNSGDTRCNRDLTDMIKGNLMQLFEKDSNIWVVQRMFGVDFQRIVECMSN